MHHRISAAVVAAVIAAVCETAAASTIDSLDAADPMTWLVKSVCIDARDRPVAADPYDGCPGGHGIRKIRPGDPLPYHNAEQIGYQRRDAFPVFDPIDGRIRVVATFDYAPFGTFNLFNGTDGYDVLTVQNGWAGIAGTSDGGGYGQAFYAQRPAPCTLGGGWVLFPARGFLSGGAVRVPHRIVYWEQSAENYPGACPSSYAMPQTSWNYRARFKFGGVNGNPVKTMDTVVSNHGFSDTPRFLRKGHLEVFYFTREYGITRWEVWTPVQQKPARTHECVVPERITYQGVGFVVQYCHDWSAYRPASTAAIPLWPIPEINLLKAENNPHFAGVAGAIPPGWALLGKVSAVAALSASDRDTGGGRRKGVAYVRLACAAGARCGGFTNALYQDLPARRLPASGTYGFGVNARSEGSGAGGAIGVAIEQLDGAGHVLWSDKTTMVVRNDNGTEPSAGEAQSVYLSSAFVSKTTTIARLPRAAAIRFLIVPQTPQITFDVLDAWFAPYPAAPPR